jgi:thiol-disulfide isomerase/thioredoxin
MKKIFSFLAVALFAASAFAQKPNIQPIAIGTTIPMLDYKMQSVNGKDYSVYDVMQKNGVLVMFSCNTCPYVIKYQQRTLDAIKMAKENGFGVIIINSNEAQRKAEDSYVSMKEYGKSQGYDVPYVVDVKSGVADAYGATRTPECFLFNNERKLVYHGAIDDNTNAAEATRNHLGQAIEEAKNGKTVTVQESRSVGCTIKRI